MSGNTTAENAAATHAYLVANNSYEEAELSDQPQEIAARETVAAGISAECPGILANAPPHEEVLGFGLVGPVSVGPASPARPSARADGERNRQARQLGDLKDELLFALSEARTQPDREATSALISALTPLKWSNPKITFLIQTIAAVAKEELELPAPPACADMKSWVASGYKTLAPASKEIASRSEALFKRTFEIIALSERFQTSAFPKTLAAYENAADRALSRHTEALKTQLQKGSETRKAVLQRVEVAVGLPAAKAPKVQPKTPARKPVVIARGKTAAGGSFVAKAKRSSGVLSTSGCSIFVTISETSRPESGLLETLSGEGTGRCLSRSHVEANQTVNCGSGRLTIEANLLPATRSVRLLLSDGATIASPAILVPARLGGPAGLYYQVVRGPSPIPVSLSELDAQGNTLAVLKLPAVVECTQHPVKYFPGGIVRLVRESPPRIPAFTIRAEHYRRLGTVHFELKLEISHEALFSEGSEDFLGEGELVPGASVHGRQTFTPRASSGCQPQPYAIVYGVLKAPHDTVLALVAGRLVPLRKVLIPARMHAGGVLVYGAFSPLPTALLVRGARGRTISREDFAQQARSVTETCEGEAEG
ncbi:MAG TPA: hypothetical protein VMD79_03560 [Solirubrobacteraceae bacterium]|nr:hypothetical protein [Solirubrobacteraceae bacterium]